MYDLTAHIYYQTTSDINDKWRLEIMCLIFAIWNFKSGFILGTNSFYVGLNSVVYMKLQHSSALLISDIIIPAPWISCSRSFRVTTDCWTSTDIKTPVPYYFTFIVWLWSVILSNGM